AGMHLRIAASTGNQYIQDFATRLHNQARRVSYFIYRMEIEDRRALDAHQSRINGDHAAIIKAIRRHDNAGLVDLLTRHVGLFHERIMRVLGTTKGAQAPLPVRFP
ncbi:MAG: FCD domain-containing protein, partial [Alphaproteobacteria bacterium]|nr:FCD domain-containing protein [Alphaproteobacteria bacterium]